MADRVLVTGAGRGLGLTLARILCERGDHVAGTVRDPARAGDLAALPGARVEVLDLAASDAIPGRVEK